MTVLFVPIDDEALSTEWHAWMHKAVRRFWTSGYGESATAWTAEEVRRLLRAPELMYADSLILDSGRRGVIIVSRSTWETDVLSRVVAKVAFFAADDLEVAQTLARTAIERAAADDVVLLSAAPGHSPGYMHVALTEAGFHVASQTLTTWEDLEQVAPALEKIPLRGAFRSATPSDADAVGALAYFAFDDQRFTRDPYFPKEWGQQLYSAWARSLVLGSADEVIVAESGGRIIGFVSMAMDKERRLAVPPLLAIDRRHNGWGTGPALLRLMLEWYRKRGVRTFVGGTEKSNTAINALHVRIGGTFIDSNIIYHASPASRGER